jgi:hypothetical protein
VEGHGPHGQRIHELVHQRVGAGHHLRRGALRRYHTRPQNDDVVRQMEGCREVVRHQHAGQAHGVVELADELGRGAQRDRVQARKGLVVHDEFGVERNGPGQGHTPAGHDPYEKKLKGITAMTSELGKKKFNELLGGLIYKPPGKPVLVETSDKRPELNTAIDDFKDND